MHFLSEYGYQNVHELYWTDLKEKKILFQARFQWTWAARIISMLSRICTSRPDWSCLSSFVSGITSKHWKKKVLLSGHELKSAEWPKRTSPFQSAWTVCSYNNLRNRNNIVRHRIWRRGRTPSRVVVRNRRACMKR